MQEGPLWTRWRARTLTEAFRIIATADEHILVGLPPPTSPKATLNGAVLVTSAGRVRPDARGSITRLVFGGRRHRPICNPITSRLPRIISLRFLRLVLLLLLLLLLPFANKLSSRTFLFDSQPGRVGLGRLGGSLIRWYIHR